jgi:hypothetical protein
MMLIETAGTDRPTGAKGEDGVAGLPTTFAEYGFGDMRLLHSLEILQFCGSSRPSWMLSGSCAFLFAPRFHKHGLVLIAIASRILA